ncbi:MAG: MFS transporter [Firmicutes bacterium HGW-Firmicutes-15]|nr:MAG: MFS transporter [Firmicutes bacterium HGW-Firmicutes-15]
MFEQIKTSPDYRWYVFATVSIGTFMSTLDSSIVNVALPTISGQFHAELSLLQWTVTAYLLAITSLLPVFGRLADMFGRKRIYVSGFVIFTIGSALCGLAPGIWFLVGTRVLQAVGAAMLMSNSAAIIVDIFPFQERGKALGLTGTVVALGSMSGPALGGLLIGLAGWRSIFYINLPLGIIGYLVAHSLLPEDKPGKGQESFDFAGAFLFAGGMISLLFAINTGSAWGWSNPPILLGMFLGLALLTLFIINERRVSHPMIALSLFRNRPFIIGNICGWLSFVAMFANTMLLPFYLQQILNYTPSQVGLLMTAFPVAMAITAPISGQASDKFGPLLLTSGGLAVSALGLFYFSTLTAAATFYQVIPGSLIMGVGAGMFQSPNNSSVMSSVPPPKLGLAGGISSLVRNVGMITGIALSVSLFELWGGITRPSINQIPIFMQAYHRVMLVAMAISLLGAFISLNRHSYAKPEGRKRLITECL